jgi:hypothetical protein
VPSRCEPTCELRELRSKRKFLGDSVPNEREENFLQYVIHFNLEEQTSRRRRGVRPTSTGGLTMLRLEARRARELPTTRKSGRQLRAVFSTNTPARDRREEDGTGHLWYCGSLVCSDILRAPAQGGYRQ